MGQYHKPERETIANDFKYAGEMFDSESGFYYLRARYYDPTMGRFISKDSNEGNIANPLSLNLYTYCENEPINHWDPTGHMSIDELSNRMFNVGAAIGNWFNDKNENYLVPVLDNDGTPTGALISTGKAVAGTIIYVGAQAYILIEAIGGLVLAAPAGEKAVNVAGNILVRQDYVNEVRGLENLQNQLTNEGYSTEEIARTLYQARRDLGVQYKNITSPEMLEKIYQRNLDKYGDKLGPTIDYLRDVQGKSWEDIIESAKTSGSEFNDLAGIK